MVILTHLVFLLLCLTKRSCSSALPQLAESLLVPFEKALWASDGGDLDRDGTGDGRRAWKLLGVICRILELAPRYAPSLQTMQNLDVCKKFYSRERPSEQDDSSVSLATLRNLLHFMFAAAKVSRDPARCGLSSLR
ncbi:hypothetical protein DFH29DRAFT_256974 [Suillus ampliporus]|nr:hypothetical protein DFH29DRAFT_256974 [Suillus ampliporus]